jgi:hypothetical protein
MRTYLICLCLLFVLCSCNKKSVLPEKYNFLLGKWRCIDCNDPTTVEIGKRSLTINPLNHRKDGIFYHNIHEEIDIDGNSFICLRGSYESEKWKFISIYTLLNNSHLTDTIKLRAGYADFYFQSSFYLVKN